uniref:Transcription and mRNA export factor ENY2 n=3 Tax=Ascarididae TaxID=6250 RepID=A0A915CEH0_PARUN
MSTSGQPVTKAALERRFIESGEGDRMKELLLQRLRETGWVEEVENMCRNVIQTKGIEQVTLEEVVAEVKGQARRAVPDEVKRELMQNIRTFLQQESGINDL